LDLNRFQVANHWQAFLFRPQIVQAWRSCVSAMHGAEVCNSTRNVGDY
jgi:hypothetical protein